MIEPASAESAASAGAGTGTGTGAGAGTAKPGSAGAMLRAAREKQGLHIAALAAAIKVSPRKLDALEGDRWAELPDATFTRALAQTVCRTLKIDARPVLDLLPAVSTAGFDATGASLNTPFRERSGRDDTGMATAAIRPMVWAGLLLMAAAVAVYLLPEGLFTRNVEPGAAVTAAPAVGAGPALPASAAAAGANGDAAPTETAQTAATQPSTMPPEAAMPPTNQAVLSAPSPVAASANASGNPIANPVGTPSTNPGTIPSTTPSANAGAASAGIVQLRTSAASWMEARDARGQVLLSRTVLPGENVGLDGSLPIRLTIGNAAVTQLGFRGKPVDLAPRTRDNVARLELQ